MNAAKPACGFYATDAEVYYVTPAGRVWVVGSDDTGPDPVELDSLPVGATLCDGLLTPDECLAHCRRVEAVSGEALVEDAGGEDIEFIRSVLDKIKGGR